MDGSRNGRCRGQETRVLPHGKDPPSLILTTTNLSEIRNIALKLLIYLSPSP